MYFVTIVVFYRQVTINLIKLIHLFGKDTYSRAIDQKIRLPDRG